jgi:hypothetical protein
LDRSRPIRAASAAAPVAPEKTGLIWLLDGREVVALTETTATIQNPAGAITIYRRHYKPALGPLGDRLDDLQ